ncbi:MAG: biotin/lipoyl-containing protein, partial [Bacteroidales bacterium]|nr:biotin/lipoyl-containing protein [Bacteroidales bacterium]
IGHVTPEPFVESPHEVVKENTREVAKKPEEKSNKEYKETINAVMAGTFYRSASADKPPLVEEGSEVKKGDPIFVLEAMKLYNEIEAPFNCKIVKILVDEATIMTKDQPAMAIEKM